MRLSKELGSFAIANLARISATGLQRSRSAVRQILPRSESCLNRSWLPAVLLVAVIASACESATESEKGPDVIIANVQVSMQPLSATTGRPYPRFHVTLQNKGTVGAMNVSVKIDTYENGKHLIGAIGGVQNDRRLAAGATGTTHLDHSQIERFDCFKATIIYDGDNYSTPTKTREYPLDCSLRTTS